MTRLARTLREGTLFFTTFLVVAMSAVGWAQSPCGVLLTEAEKRYEDGDFEQVPELLEACTKAKTSRGERADAYALTAKAYVMSDRIPQARLTIEALLRADPEFEPDPRRDPSRFARLVSEIKRESATVQVSSVSKTQESLREAPATVVVVTAEQIARRGYRDLEAVFHDLPGFDISRSFGAFYSQIYSRGFRSDTTSRIVFLIDGVEENELWTGTACITRQYPLSNISRVEVIYGPASTMYGSNAFVGVVNIITKEPDEILESGELFGADVQLLGGDWSTRSVDVTMAGRNRSGGAQFTLTGRIYQSDGWDLSPFSDWDYDPAFYETVDYAGLLNITGTENGEYLAKRFLKDNPLASPYYTIQRNATGEATAILLTPEGIRHAVGLDQALLLNGFDGEPITAGNQVDDWAVHGKVKFTNLTLGFQAWRKDENADGSYTDRSILGGSTGTGWVVEESRFYINYSRRLSQTLQLDYFGRYKEHRTDGDSFLPFTNSYAGGQLTLLDLIEDKEAFIFSTYYFSSSTEFRNEVKLVYNPNMKSTLVGGVEIRKRSIPGDLIQSSGPNPEETGAPLALIQGGNRFASTNLGIFAQASYRLRTGLKVVLGGRIDNNKVRKTGGFGTVFTPRLALIFSRGDWVFKGIYAEAFQDATNHQKYVTSPGVQELNAPDLAPEEVNNLELSASWQPAPDLQLEIVGYDAWYSETVQGQLVPCTDPTVCTTPETLQYQNTGERRIKGIQINGSYQWRGFYFFGNYTFTDPRQPNPVDESGAPLTDAEGNALSELRIGDISSQRLNFGVNAETKRFGYNLRFNYVGTRDTGYDTTIRENPLDEIDSYFLAHLTLSYRSPVSGVTAQLLVNNVFDTEYFHPGTRGADGNLFPTRHPQPMRAVFGRILYSF